MSTRVRIGLVATFAGITAVVACTFPQVGFQGAGGGGGAATGSSSSSSTSGAGGHGATTSASSSSGSTSASSSSSTSSSSTSSSSSSASSSSSSSSSGCIKPCDCDGDGDPANTPACGGGDCNDHDPLVNSKQTKWFTQPGSNGWDYNCDGVDEYEFTDFLNCGAFTSCDMSTDKWSSGQGTPACGAMGQYGTCAGVIFFNCYEQAKGMRAQGCH